jgi:molybdopterin molybdotransferase
MRSPEEAIGEILLRARPHGETERVPLARAAGRVLARDVSSDVDLPPFQKSAMDGYAVRSSDFERADPESGLVLAVVGESIAGHPFPARVPPGTAVLITTGAEVPADCDAVVIVEKSRAEGGSEAARVRLLDRPRAGQHICNRGEDLACGASVFRAPRRLSATDVSVLGSVGCEPVTVFRRPRVAIVSTGDELVPPERMPGAGEIRESNSLHLAALAARAGADVLSVERVRDEPKALARAFGAALESADVVLTTGGVSAGKYDLVAGVFVELGVREVFHGVAIKPGKPLWFGMRESTRPVLVFGLPGNPVSCLLDHEVFVRPALARIEGAPEEESAERLRLGRWEGDGVRGIARQQNLPVRVTQGADGVERLEPLVWSSSADIVGLASADGMAVVPAGERLERGALARYRPLR